MQEPFWKAEGHTRVSLESDFFAILHACAAVGIKMVVVPLVDNGRIDNDLQENTLVVFMQQQLALLTRLDIQILFESDFPPQELERFIGRFDGNRFGINYDIGNSAALGYDPAKEFAAYGSRILNVHVKDRLLGGTTVPLAKGASQFEIVFSELAKLNYKGNFILQTARADNGNHSGVLQTYFTMTKNWIRKV